MDKVATKAILRSSDFPVVDGGRVRQNSEWETARIDVEEQVKALAFR